MISEVDRPRLTRSLSEKDRINIVHLGLGAFFRAFSCNFFQDMKEIKNAEINVLGVSLKTADLVDSLRPQGGLYTNIEKGPNDVSLRVIDVIKEVVFAPRNPGYVLQSLASLEVSVVTLTLTEKGYCFIPNSGKLDLNHPDILFDLENPNNPRSAIGYLVYALQIRKENGLKPFSCLSFDNLPRNGNILSEAVLQFAKIVDDELFQWIFENGAFPSSMVDRIVPSTSEEDKNLLRSLVSYDDHAPTVHEPYSLWVIEDKFVQAHPFDFQSVGVPLVTNIENFEKMKLRCLNGTHSALAYLGYLSGFKTIYDAVSNPIFESFLLVLWSTEILPSLIPPSNFVLREYVNELMYRYKNPKIKHLTSQIAMDGSQKIPQRVLSTIEDNLIQSRKIDLLCEIVAGWIRYTMGKDESGENFVVLDPNAEKFLKIHSGEERTNQVIQKFFSLDSIFSKYLKESRKFNSKLKISFERQQRIGSLKSVEEAVK